MKKLRSINQIFEKYKRENEESKIIIETADEVVEIINKIVKARRNLNLSQRDLAKKCGIKQPALARIEQFNVIPKLNTIIKIAKCVNVEINAKDKNNQNEQFEDVKCTIFEYRTVKVDVEGGYKWEKPALRAWK